MKNFITQIKENRLKKIALEREKMTKEIKEYLLKYFHDLDIANGVKVDVPHFLKANYYFNQNIKNDRDLKKAYANLRQLKKTLA